MLISFHKEAPTMPATSMAAREAHGAEAELPQRFGVDKFSIRKWRKRTIVEDGSHTPYRPQTALHAGQEEIVVYLRIHLRLPLDDLLAVMSEFIELAMRRSALNQLLRRHGVNRVPEPKVTATQVKSFKAYEPGYVHMDVKYLPHVQDETERRHSFVTIDRARRWVLVHLYDDQSEGSNCDFLRRLQQPAPMQFSRVLTDNGSQFGARFTGKGKKPSDAYAFDKRCAALGFDHCLTPQRRPQTSGIVTTQRSHRRGDYLDAPKVGRGARGGLVAVRAALHLEHLRALYRQAPLLAQQAWRDLHQNLFTKQFNDHPMLNALDLTSHQKKFKGENC